MLPGGLENLLCKVEPGDLSLPGVMVRAKGPLIVM